MNNLEKARKLIACNKTNYPIYISCPSTNTNTIDVANTYTINSSEKAMVKNIGNNKNALLEFYIPKGENGSSLNNAAYIVTFEDKYPDQGLEIKELGKLPLTRIELDTESICTLDNNSLKFNKDGYYKVTFNVNAYINSNTPFDLSKDFITLGFREENTDNIYIGGSSFITDSAPTSIYAHGLLSIYDTNKLYELVNLSKRTIYLKTPNLENINSNSYFVNAPISIIIEYIGKSNQSF